MPMDYWKHGRAIADILDALRTFTKEEICRVLNAVAGYHDIYTGKSGHVEKVPPETTTEQAPCVLYGRPADDEEADLQALCYEFSRSMYAKMCQKYHEDDYVGWDDDSDTDLPERLLDDLKEHLKKPLVDLVDIANYSAFIWNLQRKKS